MRLLLACAAAIALIGATPTAFGGSEAAGPRPVLGAVDAVTGTRTAVAPVFLTVAATIGQTEVAGVKITGGGRIAGALLVGPQGVALLALKLNDCITAGCDPARGASRTFVEAQQGQTLGPGSYIVYLIADSTPVRVDFRLSGPSGTAAFPAVAPASVTFAEPVSSIPVHGGNVYSAGASGVIGAHGGIGLSELLLEASEFVLGDYGACTYQGPPPSAAYVPGCPGGAPSDYGPLVPIPPIPSNISYAQTLVESLGPGAWGLGNYHATVASIRAVYALNMWLSFDSLTDGLNGPQDPTTALLPATTPTSSLSPAGFTIALGALLSILFGIRTRSPNRRPHPHRLLGRHPHRTSARRHAGL